MSFDDREFRRALGRFTTGVAVMTVSHAGNRAGITANSFASVSLDPPLVLWCLDRQAGSLGSFTSGPGFAVNVLSAEQITVSNAFAQPGAKDWDCAAWGWSDNGHPALEGALATFDCVRHAVHDGGDHVILVGRVTSLSIGQGEEPLLYYRGGYRGIAGLPAA